LTPLLGSILVSGRLRPLLGEGYLTVIDAVAICPLLSCKPNKKTRTRSKTVPQISIAAELRSDFGKGAARRLRRAGLVPAVIYGAGSDLIHVSISAHELGLALKQSKVVLEVTGAGSGKLVAPREVQKDPVRQEIEHVDLVVLTADEVKARLS
jgi:ribosomal protein L25 (general stress protein Ctc)